MTPGARFVGVLERRGRFHVAQPFFGPGRGVTVDVRGARGRTLRAGDLVFLGKGKGGRSWRVEAVLGNPRSARDVIEALMLERGLRRRFAPDVEHEARVAAAGDGHGGAREDLRELETFTIDPVTARDFDDAISARRTANVVCVWVHIADVAAFVAPGTALDREAHRRGTSVYVPGAVEPMLPLALSNDACSLIPGADRAAVTVQMEVDLDAGAVVGARFARTLIRSDVRLDYDRVDRIFAGRDRAPPACAAPLDAARAAAAALASSRTGALAVESSEPEFEFNRAGDVTGVTASVQTESHRLIEHLMIAANEQVARLLSARRLGALYRVHERPTGERARRLAAQLDSLGVPTPPLPEQPTPQQAADAVAEMSRRVAEHVRRAGTGRRALTSLVLRALQQAYYTPQNLGHAGLHSGAYCHFTSPIRRYPDLVCHRALLDAIGAHPAGAHAPASSGLAELGEWASAREREAMTLERDCDDIARCFLLESVLAQRGWETEWEGEVTGLIGAGAFVAFGEGFEGMLAVRRLSGDTPSGAQDAPFGAQDTPFGAQDWWELNEQGTILRGSRTGRTLRLGDPVTVAVRRVEAPRGRVDLERR